jgi:protein-L-isoaspartate O-methyltransferase
MESRKEAVTPPAEVQAHYATFPEESRLSFGPDRLEFERTKEILSRFLPPPPARIVDVGGAAGVYSLWLAGKGYEVHLVDASPRLVEEARKRSAQSATPLASMTVGDARQLQQADGSAAAILVMGPLYHLTAEAFIQIRDRDIQDGQHRNPTDNADYFTTAYFHRPEDLHSELKTVGFHDVEVLGVEGPGWILQDFDARWEHPELRRDLIEVSRALESEGSILGASAHLLGLGRK